MCTALVVSLLTFPGVRVEASDGSVTVDIVHTNDIHGRSGYDKDEGVFGFDKLASYIDQENPDLVIDAGDLYHGQAFATMEQGGSIAQLVQAVGYDIVTPGNHDWNYGKERLKELGNLSGVEILAGNVTENGANFFGNDGTYVETIKEQDGDEITVGVLGVFDQDIKDDTAPSNIEGLDFAKDAEKATELAARLRNEDGCDIVIAVSHQLDCGAFIAETSGIDVLIAGHEHEVINSSYSDKDGKTVYVVETGSYFENVGKLTLTYNLNTNTVELQEELVSVNDVENLPSDPDVTEILTEIQGRQEDQLSEVVGKTGRDLDGTWESLRIDEIGMGRLVTAAYLDETGADVAFENAGGIRIGRVLKAGDITWRDIIDTAPYGNYIVTKEISGKALLEILERSIEIGRQDKLSYDEWVQTGAQVSWPDNSGSYLQFAGISVQYDMSKPMGERVISARVGSEDLNPDAMYTIATNNFVALGGDYVQLKDAPEINQFSACDEALEAFVSKGQEVVDAATGTAWLQQVSEDDQDDGQTEDNGNTNNSGNTGDTGNSGASANNGSAGSNGSSVNNDQKANQITAAAKTGDDSSTVWLFAVLCSVSVIACAAVPALRTRSVKKREDKR